MQIRLRSLFLITTVVAIVVFTFTLGTGEGVFALVFFASIFGPSKRKDRWVSGILLVILLVGYGVCARHFVRTGLERPSYGKTDYVDIFFTDSDQKRQREVFDFLVSDMPYGKTGMFHMSRSSTVPFFRAGYIQLSFSKEKQADIEAEVRRRIGEPFPDLNVSIESHSTFGTEGRPRP